MSKESLDNLRAYQLFSFGDAHSLGSGTLAEGIALKIPNVRPFILPEQIYGDVSAKPVLTLATRSILMASENLDITIVYDIVASLVQKPQTLAAYYPLILEELGKDFDPKKLMFPLHEGSLRYLNRDLPNILERHADVLSLLLAAVLALGSGLYGLFQYRQNVKKDRIDLYLNKIIELRRKITEIDSDEIRHEIREEIKAVQREVMQKVIDEKLNADVSLTIFINMSNQVLAEAEAQS